jgi:hypothetical protein
MITDNLITVGGESISLLDENINRSSVMITNPTDETIYLGYGPQAMIGSEMFIEPNGYHRMESDYTGQITAICSSSDKTIKVVEIS